MKKFTGDINQWHKCREHLQQEGYYVSDAIHIGDNKFEFIEDTQRKGEGYHHIYKFLAYIEDGEVVYTKKIIGDSFVDCFG